MIYMYNCKIFHDFSLQLSLFSYCKKVVFKNNPESVKIYFNELTKVHFVDEYKRIFGFKIEKHCQNFILNVIGNLAIFVNLHLKCLYSPTSKMSSKFMLKFCTGRADQAV